MDAKLYSTTIDVKTTSVAKSLADLIAREKVHPASVDFDILKIQTLIKEPKRDEYVPLTKDHLEKLRDKEYLLDPALQFTQEYELHFRPFMHYPFKFNFSLTADKFRSQASIVLKAGSVIKPNTDIKLLFLYFNKIKLKNNMLIYLFDDQLRAGLKNLLQYANGEPFKSDVALTLAAWQQPVETIDDRLIWHFQEKNKVKNENDRINYADRGFVSPVLKDELLVEYIYPKQGQHGRSFTGALIQMPEPKVENAPQFTADDATVTVQNDEAHRCFIAKTDGYVKFENNALSIDTVMQVSEVSLKTTGNIRAGLDKGVRVVIEGKDIADEVIGVDMVVEASAVSANGSVANGALVMAQNIVIKGQTHQKSELIAKNIEVNVLRGVARGEDVKVNMLEGGSVHALRANIGQAVGGEVSALHIKVDNLRGKSTMTAAHTITVGQVTKGDNRLIIDPSAKTADREAILAAHDEIEQYRKHIDDNRRLMEVNVGFLAKNANSFKQIQLEIIKDKQNGRQTGESYMRMAREYLAVQKKQDEYEAAITQMQKKIAERHDEIGKYDASVLQARVINERVVWAGHNDICFTLPVIGRDFVQVIEDGMRVKEVGLVENQEGEFEIKLVYG